MHAGVFVHFVVQIGNVRADVEKHEKRIAELEERPKNRVWEIVLQFKGIIISAILLALAGWCMGIVTDLIKVARSDKPPLPPVEKPQ